MGSVVIHVNDAMKSTEWYWDKLAFETVGLDVFVRAAGFQGVLIDLCELCNDRRNDRPDGRTGILVSVWRIIVPHDGGNGGIVLASNPDEVEKAACPKE